MSEEAHTGRHLLAEAEKGSSNGTFVSQDGVKVFLKSVTVSITPKPKADEKPVTFTHDFPFDDASALTFDKVNDSVK